MHPLPSEKTNTSQRRNVSSSEPFVSINSRFSKKVPLSLPFGGEGVL
jgi:hypothetical protein